MAEEKSEGALVRSARAIEGAVEEYGPVVLVAVAGIGWALLRGFILEVPANESTIRMIGRLAVGLMLAAAGIGGAILAYRRSGEIRKLKEQNRDSADEIDSLQDTILRLYANAKEAWRVRLGLIFQEIGLDDTFRISIYRFSPDSETFQMIGRYAAITRFGHTGRGVYPAHVGCIGRAWESPQLEASVTDLPENEDEFVKRCCEDWGFEEEAARMLNMKSRSVYAFTIRTALEMDRTAVIVFESTEPDAGDVGVLREAVQDRYRKQLLSDLDTIEFIEPSPELAREAGL